MRKPRAAHVAEHMRTIAHLPWAARVVALADFAAPQGETWPRRKAFDWALRHYPWDQEVHPWL